MTDAKDKYIAQLESVVREQWGVLLLAATLHPEDAKLQAAFARVDALCRKTGLMAREGMRFLEPAEN